LLFDRNLRPVRIEREQDVVSEEVFARFGELEQQLVGVLADAGFAGLQPDIDLHAAVAIQHIAGKHVFAQRPAGDSQHLQRAIEDVDRPRLKVVVLARFGHIGNAGPQSELVRAPFARLLVEFRLGDLAVDEQDLPGIDNPGVGVVRALFQKVDRPPTGRRRSAPAEEP